MKKYILIIMLAFLSFGLLFNITPVKAQVDFGLELVQNEVGYNKETGKCVGCDPVDYRPGLIASRIGFMVMAVIAVISLTLLIISSIRLAIIKNNQDKKKRIKKRSFIYIILFFSSLIIFVLLYLVASTISSRF